MAIGFFILTKLGKTLGEALGAKYGASVSRRRRGRGIILATACR